MLSMVYINLIYKLSIRECLKVCWNIRRNPCGWINARTHTHTHPTPNRMPENRKQMQFFHVSARVARTNLIVFISAKNSFIFYGNLFKLFSSRKIISQPFFLPRFREKCKSLMIVNLEVEEPRHWTYLMFISHSVCNILNLAWFLVSQDVYFCLSKYFFLLCHCQNVQKNFLRHFFLFEIFLLRPHCELVTLVFIVFLSFFFACVSQECLQFVLPLLPQACQFWLSYLFSSSYFLSPRVFIQKR